MAKSVQTSNMEKPNVGAVVRVTTRWPNQWVLATSPWDDYTYEGVVVRSNAWDQPDTFKLQVANPAMPVPVIQLKRVHTLEYVSGSGSKVSSEIKTLTVPGSKGNVYTVTKVGGVATCTCPGFQFRKACKHLDLVRK